MACTQMRILHSQQSLLSHDLACWGTGHEQRNVCSPPMLQHGLVLTLAWCAGILMHDMQTTQDYGLILHTNLEFDGVGENCHSAAHKDLGQLTGLTRACVSRRQWCRKAACLSASMTAGPPA